MTLKSVLFPAYEQKEQLFNKPNCREINPSNFVENPQKTKLSIWKV